jgi:hypothetical protein
MPSGIARYCPLTLPCPATTKVPQPSRLGPSLRFVQNTDEGDARARDQRFKGAWIAFTSSAFIVWVRLVLIARHPIARVSFVPRMVTSGDASSNCLNATQQLIRRCAVEAFGCRRPYAWRR